MEFTSWQKDLLALLTEKGLSREDIYSVMLVLTKEEKGKQLLSFLEEEKEFTPDEICEKAGKIAFGENP